MAFTYDITTDIGSVRLLIGDTVNLSSNPAQFSDEEIQFFLNLGGSVLMGAAKALESWASTETGKLDSEKIGDYSYTRGSSNKKLTLAEKYIKQDSMIPVFTWSEYDLTAGSAITAEED